MKTRIISMVVAVGLMNERNEAIQVRLPIVVFIIVSTYCSMLVPLAWSHSSSADTSSADIQQGTAYGAGMEAASAAATILYFPFKAAFAIAGGIVGGLAYVFSGFSEPTAKNIRIPSTFGTYVITPEHLTGERPVRFLGVAAEREGGASPAAVHD
ncbi:MAG TPA: hypothetical protein VN647_06640 [Nitrospira sp.]|nr:hypothetical protein [Nitrospira sp.]